MLVLRRTAQGAGRDQPLLGQQLFDRFCQDMDDNFREMGVGDLAVPKEMRRVAEAFYGRAKAYESALAADDPAALAAALARNVFGAAEPPLGARRLAAYMREASRPARRAGADALARGRARFPDPEAMAPGIPQHKRDHEPTKTIRRRSRPALERSGRGRRCSGDRPARRAGRRRRHPRGHRKAAGIAALPRLEARSNWRGTATKACVSSAGCAATVDAELRGDA